MSAVPTLPAVEMHLHRPTEPGVGVVVRNELCTASRKAAGFVRHIEIDVSNTDLAGRFRAGQSFGVIPPGVTDKGQPHKVRLYSIASPTRGEDGNGNVLATTVKRTIDEHWDSNELFLGVASNYLCDLNVGDSVSVTGPNGKRFLLPEPADDHRYLFFATGTGIAPFRGMVHELFTGSTTTQADASLVMGAPYATDLLYHAELTDLAATHAGFNYLTAISREHQDDVNRKLYVQDRLETHRDQLQELLEDDRTLLYVCGIAGMELGIFQQLARILGPEKLEAYLEVDPEVAGTPEDWDRRMIPRKIRPTKRVFLEVY